MNYVKEDKSANEHYDVVLEDIEDPIRPRQGKSVQKEESPSGWQLFAGTGEVGFEIALPMTVGLIVGVKVDEMWGTRPKATLAFFLVGLVISCASLIRIVRDNMNRR